MSESYSIVKRSGINSLSETSSGLSEAKIVRSAGKCF